MWVWELAVADLRDVQHVLGVVAEPSPLSFVVLHKVLIMRGVTRMMIMNG
jgi:hypothetical protein